MNRLEQCKGAALIAVAVCIASGCATPADPGRMVPQSLIRASAEANPPLRGAIAIGEVGGGEPTHPWLTPKVGNQELHDAVHASLGKHGFLSNAGAAAPYRLDVFLAELKQAPGFTMIAHAFVRYRITRTSDTKVVWDEIITGSSSASVGDEFYGPSRARLVAEGAIRANIAAFLENLSALPAGDAPLPSR